MLCLCCLCISAQRRLSSFLLACHSSLVASDSSDSSSSSSSIAQRSVVPSEFGTLLDSLFGASAAAPLSGIAQSAEKRAALELCFRKELDSVARQMREAQRKENAVEGVAAAALSSASHPLCLLVDAALWCKHAKVLEATAPLAMLEESIESHSLAISEQIFTKILMPRSKLLSAVSLSRAIAVVALSNF